MTTYLFPVGTRVLGNARIKIFIIMNQKIKVGIVANEFFDPSLNRVGGFGWAARRAAEVFKERAIFASPILLSGEQLNLRKRIINIDGVKLIQKRKKWKMLDIIESKINNLDVILCVDYRPHYLYWMSVFSGTPVIIWVRDPRTPADVARIRTLRMPGRENEVITDGLPDWDYKSLSKYINYLNNPNRPIVLANKMAYMKGNKDSPTFDMPSSDFVLPNPNVCDYKKTKIDRNEKPTVLFLGRLDPVKRPWLYVELARSLPDVEFWMAGQRFVGGKRSWDLTDIPSNLKLHGNISGMEKAEVLSRSWLLVNTSIHEESAVSMLEALAYEMPVVSFIESDGISARFGKCLGYVEGSGMDALDDLKNAVTELLNDHDRRIRLGKEGRNWVESEHNDDNFEKSFINIYTKIKK